MSGWTRAVVLCGILSLAMQSAADGEIGQATYSLTWLTSGTNGFANGINNQGQVAGEQLNKGWLWNPGIPNGTAGVMTNLSSHTGAFAINSSGQVSANIQSGGPNGAVNGDVMLLTPVPEPTQAVMLLWCIGCSALCRSWRTIR